MPSSRNQAWEGARVLNIDGSTATAAATRHIGPVTATKAAPGRKAAPTTASAAAATTTTVAAVSTAKGRRWVAVHNLRIRVARAGVGHGLGADADAACWRAVSGGGACMW